MTFADILQLCGKITVAQLLTRDDFAKRYSNQTPIYLHECLYPMMQAWDSVMVQADIELGGTEQLYSFMLARDLQRDQNLPQQIGVMSPILVGTDGEQKMGKSLGNYIGISESAVDMMKKFMQIPDSVMEMYFKLLTNIPLEEVKAILAGHPKDAKIRLAKTVIAGYHSAEQADEAVDRWQREVGGGELPTDIPTVVLNLQELAKQLPQCQSDLAQGRLAAPQLLKVTGLVPSTSDAMRLIAQGGMTIYDDHQQPSTINDSKASLVLKTGMLSEGRKEENRTARNCQNRLCTAVASADFAGKCRQINTSEIVDGQ